MGHVFVTKRVTCCGLCMFLPSVVIRHVESEIRLNPNTPASAIRVNHRKARTTTEKPAPGTKPPPHTWLHTPKKQYNVQGYSAVLYCTALHAAGTLVVTFKRFIWPTVAAISTSTKPNHARNNTRPKHQTSPAQSQEQRGGENVVSIQHVCKPFHIGCEVYRPRGKWRVSCVCGRVPQLAKCGAIFD